MKPVTVKKKCDYPNLVEFKKQQRDSVKNALLKTGISIFLVSCTAQNSVPRVHYKIDMQGVASEEKFQCMSTEEFIDFAVRQSQNDSGVMMGDISRPIGNSIQIPGKDFIPVELMDDSQIGVSFKIFFYDVRDEQIIRVNAEIIADCVKAVVAEYIAKRTDMPLIIKRELARKTMKELNERIRFYGTIEMEIYCSCKF